MDAISQQMLGRYFDNETLTTKRLLRLIKSAMLVGE